MPFQLYFNVSTTGNTAARQGSCKGDSGGPLMIFNTKNYRYEQVAIVAGGLYPEDCGNTKFPGIYTRLDHPDIVSFVKSSLIKIGNIF